MGRRLELRQVVIFYSLITDWSGEDRITWEVFLEKEIIWDGGHLHPHSPTPAYRIK